MRSALLLIAVLGSIMLVALFGGHYLASATDDTAGEYVQYEPLPPPIPGGAGADAAPGDGGQGQTAIPATRRRAADTELCRITARFVDELGDPIPGARVQLGHDPESYMVSNEHGRVDWRVPDERSLAGRTRPMVLRTFCNGFAARACEVEFTPGQLVQLGDVELKPGGAVSGQIVDADGEPVRGARVMFSRPALPHDTTAKNRLWGPSEVLLETRADDDGVFYLEGAPTGLCRVWAKALGSSYHYTGAFKVEQNHAATDVRIKLSTDRL